MLLGNVSQLSIREAKVVTELPVQASPKKTVLGKRHHYSQAISKWAKAWRTPGLSQHVKVSFSPRLRKTLGRVRPKSGSITLNAKLASAPRAVLLEILCHEAAHVAAFLLHGSRAKPHGSEWRSLIHAAGYQPSTSLKCRSLPQPPPPSTLSHRHHYLCPVCQADYFVRRRNSRLHCSTCLRAGVTSQLRLISSP